MTDLLTRAARRSSSSSRPETPEAPGAVMTGAALAAVLAAAVGLAVTVLAVLVAWLLTGGGQHGDLADALAVGAHAWLMAHGSGLDLTGVTVTVVPLALTAFAGWAAFRGGRWTASRSRVEPAVPLRMSLVMAVTLSAVYAGVAVLVAALVGLLGAGPSLPRAGAGALLLGLLAGGAGVLRGAGRTLAPERSRAWSRVVIRGAGSSLLLVWAGAAVLVAASLLADFGTATTLLSGVAGESDPWASQLTFTVANLAFAPNAVLWGAAFLLGPGFAVGVGTVVSPSAVVLGPVPAVPLLAALPADSATPGWAPWLMALPVVVSLVAAAGSAVTGPPSRYDVGAAQGLAGGVVAAGVLTALVHVAGGAAGPGRMLEVGASAGSLLLPALAALGGGGLLGGLLGTWWSHRRTSTGDDPPPR